MTESLLAQKIEINGEELYARYVAKRFETPAQVAAFLDALLNNYGRMDSRFGKEVGELLSQSHPTVQRAEVCFAFGLLEGMAKEQHTDERNAKAIRAARDVARQLKSGSLDLGVMV